MSHEISYLTKASVEKGMVSGTIQLVALPPFSTPVLTLLSSRKLWETLQEFSQNLAIWTSRRMLLEQTGN